LSRARAVTRSWSCGGSSACFIAGARHSRTPPHLASRSSMRSSTARAAGLPVEVHVDGQLDAISPGLDLVAYRVVQEALTNAIKHAGVARARVNVSVGVRWLELRCQTTGTDRRRAATTTMNHVTGLSG
jgi:signal transduction histidine kinase